MIGFLLHAKVQEKRRMIRRRENANQGPSLRFPCMHDIRKKIEKVENVSISEGHLCETKVFASGGDGCEDLLTEDLVALIFGKIKFYFSLVQGHRLAEECLRLKHVCELGRRSLLP
jgi:hypothetical protein